MIVGIGTDVCSIDRIAKSLERFGDRFVKRILTPHERARYAGIQLETSHAVTSTTGGCARVANAVIPFLESLLAG